MASSIENFLCPLEIDVAKLCRLMRSLRQTYEKLAACSEDQFLPTPILESVLRPEIEGDESGKYLSIDIGGTNLRVGFIELLPLSQTQNGHRSSAEEGHDNDDEPTRSRVRRHLEKAWPIEQKLKMNKAEDLFEWIGTCIAEVVGDGLAAWPGELPEQIPLGVTFSFPMIQHTLSDATLMPMGKGFAVTSNLDLARQLLQGYETTRDSCSPNIKLIAIANDAVATLVSFAYQFRCNPRQKAVMGLIVGTGCNATIPLALSKLRPSKRPSHAQVLDHLGREGDMKIVVNAEWGINGTAGPLRDLDFITRWDTKLDEEGEHPGFMPFEYMTAGRCLGELGRIIIVDYFTTHLSIAYSTLPPKLQQRLGLTTSFLGNLGSRLAHPGPSMVEQLEGELPPAEIPAAWHWTPAAASIVYKIARAIQIRAAGMVAAATVALLSCADEIQLSPPSPPSSITAGVTSGHTAAAMQELMVGYTGGCIMHFQDYLPDCQTYIDEIMRAEFGDEEGEVPRVVLRPCHDGGIIGAGILAATVEKTPLPPQPS